MQLIDATEKRLVDEIINRGYQHAAQSFSSITGQNVTIEATSIEYKSDHDYILEDYNDLVDFIVLQTDIIGSLGGASYLIFSKEESKAVSEMSLAAFGNPDAIGETAVLKEVDNIISAAMITELSNAFKISIYGDVPQLFEVKSIQSLYKHFNKGTVGYYLLAHTNFTFEGQLISPVFIWKMDDSLMNVLYK
ncbi:MAG: hypothetical protein AAF944_00735 [Bacteroidota bacterium]